MRTALTPSTAAGRQLIERVQAVVNSSPPSVIDHDEHGSFPFEVFEQLRHADVLWAPAPAEAGGGGVESVCDLVAASALLSGTHPSIALGINMHWMVLLSLTTQHRRAIHADQQGRAESVLATLRAIVQHGVVTATAASERNQDLSRPTTTATRTLDGWSVSGHKICCTLVPVADVLSVAVSVDGADGPEYAFAQVPVTAHGVTVHDDWDSLGMRASGSHSVTFDDVRLPAGAVSAGFTIGPGTPMLLDRYLASGAMHAATTLGIALAAHARALTHVNRFHAECDPPARALQLIAENVVACDAATANLGAAAATIDAHLAGPFDADQTAMTERFARVQSAKAFVDRTAVAIVDRAMELVGGSAYGRRHPLAQAYRDVRAGAFMHPLGANRAWDYVALAALERRPALT